MVEYQNKDRAKVMVSEGDKEIGRRGAGGRMYRQDRSLTGTAIALPLLLQTKIKI